MSNRLSMISHIMERPIEDHDLRSPLNASHAIFSFWDFLGISWLSNQPIEVSNHNYSTFHRALWLLASNTAPPSNVYSSAWMLITFALSLAVVILYFVSFQRLSHIPGPRLAAHSRLWLVAILGRGNSTSTFENISKEYGTQILL